MGTNFMDYLTEAHRVVKINGRLKIAEVKSRIKNPEKFIAAVEEVGFEFVSQDADNSHFVDFEFRKATARAHSSREDPAELLQPCIYKRR